MSPSMLALYVHYHMMLEWNPQALVDTLFENKLGVIEDLLVFFGDALIKVDKGRVLSHLSDTLILSEFNLPARRPLDKWLCVGKAI